MAANDLELLRQFAREQSQDAFTELVRRHLGLVYSAALRQARSTHLAEEISQTVFTSLARHAAKLAPDTILTAWLYRATRNAAIDVIRAEARRQAREQLSVQMSATNESPADWSHIEPLLDEAVDSLDETDRTAILLRYFENKSLQEVGAAIGASEDAAQKRVSRATERLREFFSKRKVTVSAVGLATLLSAHAVQAVPAALLTTVATSAVLGSTAISTSTAVTTTTIAMTTTQKIVIALLLGAAIAGAAYEGIRAGQLSRQVQTLQQQQEQAGTVKRERDQANARLAQVIEENAALKQRPTDVLKLRGQVGQLKRENQDMGSKSPMSKLTANPEAREMMRDQQKKAMAMLYGKFIKDAKLSPDLKAKFADILADHVMDNVDQITVALRDKPSQEEIDKVFAAQNAVLQQKVIDLLGQDAGTQFNEYSKNIGSLLTAEQFKDELAGTADEKKAKAEQLSNLMQAETASALAAAGLPADYQVVPMLNFANIASEQEGDRSLKLLETIYDSVKAKTGSFLNAGEQKKFDEFTKAAIGNNRMGLTLNRTMMAPIAQ